MRYRCTTLEREADFDRRSTVCAWNPPQRRHPLGHTDYPAGLPSL